MNPWLWWRHALSPFTTPTTVVLAEDCPCGASTTIEGATLQDATRHLETWRTGHKHEIRPEEVSRETGAFSQAELAPGIGFSGGDCA